MINVKFMKSRLTGNVYPQQVCSQSVNTRHIADKLRERYGSVAPCVVNDAIDIITAHLVEGNTVTLDRFGTFSLRLGITKSDATATDEVRAQNVKVKGIRFIAARTLRRQVSRQSIHRKKDAEISASTTTAIRWNVFLTQMLKDSGSLQKPLGQLPVTVHLYRMYTGATDYTARKDLDRLSTDGTLIDVSTGHSKVYLIRTKP